MVMKNCVPRSNILPVRMIVICCFVLFMICAYVPVSAGEWVHCITIPAGAIDKDEDKGNVKIAGFTDEKNGIACFFNEIQYTHDGGLHWNPATAPIIQYLSYIEILDAKNAWVNGSRASRFSPDGGITWSELPAYGPMYETGRVSFISPSVGWYGVVRGGTVPAIARTNDGGHSWMPVNTPAVSVETLWAINLVTEDTGFILLFDGQVYRTDNAGKQWRKMGKPPVKGRRLPGDNFGIASSAIRFSDLQNGVIVIYFVKPRGYAIFATSDGGKTWIEEKLPEEARSFMGSVYLSHDGKYLTITDLENSSVVMCKRK
jgi:photosystem II stability/assembly factor-like uncharacterized protein